MTLTEAINHLLFHSLYHKHILHCYLELFFQEDIIPEAFEDG